MASSLTPIGLLIIALGCFHACHESQPNNTIWVEEVQLYVNTHEVSVGDFRQFVQKTNYTTTADSFGWSGYFNATIGNWEMAEHANWEKPDGKTTAEDLFPVTQVSYADAQAFCLWKGGRLPTANEWGKFTQETFSEGNIWQGHFPSYDYGTDGFSASTAPIGSFPPSSNGLYDLFGNVWEWTSTKEQFKNEHIIKGGSFLCEQSVCAGYVKENYQTTPATSGLNHLGFRCVYER